jgi:hypothetical protein
MTFASPAERRAFLAGVNVAATLRERPTELADNADRGERVQDVLREVGIDL